MEEVKEELKPCPFCGDIAEIEVFEVKRLFRDVKHILSNANAVRIVQR